ncbi:MAG TPA: DUF3160 domain-containing protein [Anaerolineae bacterium]|nr:DUF3160 domain-containing protein [Anaerolineae bacterium]HQH37826.1 DUF3160 domain-containing protein [Anaerolineae bacterium]
MKIHSGSMMRLTLITLALALILGCQLSSPTTQPSPTTETRPTATLVTPPTATAEITPEAPTPTPPNIPAVQPRAKSVFAPYNPQPVAVTPALVWPAVAPDLSNVHIAMPLSTDQLARLARDGVVASPGLQEQEFFTVYEKARYANVPIFVTSDSLLHVYHLMFDKTLRTAESEYFYPLLKALNSALIVEADAQYQQLRGTPWEDAALRTVAFIAVSGRLADPAFPIPDYAAELAEAEIGNVEAAAGLLPSPIFPGLAYGEDYTQYIPRGHYTRSDALKAYFKSMMWYGRMTFRLKTDDAAIGRAETRSALLLVRALRNTQVNGRPALDAWADLYDPTAFLVGRSDDLTALDYIPVIDAVYGENPALATLADDAKLDTFIAATDALPAPRILGLVIAASDEETRQTKGLRFMGQRFVPDAYIFRQLIYRNVGTATERRGLPKGLDLFAAMGSERAYELLDSMGDTKYLSYTLQMDKMRAWIGSLTEQDWTETVYNGWLYTFYPLLEAPGAGYPTFMQSIAWRDKQLHTVLGSWAELKHDTILYAKQTYAEMGAGWMPTPPDPLPARGYVEPVPEFYARVAALAAMTREGLASRSLLGKTDADNLASIEELALALKQMAEKQLQGIPLTEDEHERIRYYGGELEHLVMASADTPAGEPGGTPSMEENPQAAVIADVATDPDPDGDGIPNPTVLEEGVGRIGEIHVVVPLVEEDGSLRLQVAKGGIFSYYEFQWPADDRLTDEKWRRMLDDGTAPPQPDWIDSFFTPEGEYSDLQSALYAFQRAWVNAVFYLDTQYVASEYNRWAGGEALDFITAEINALKAQKHFEGRQWMGTDYRSFDLQSATLAVVTVREAWQDTLYAYSGTAHPAETGNENDMQEIGTRGPYSLDVTYTLERTGDGEDWMVTRIVVANARPAW